MPSKKDSFTDTFQEMILFLAPIINAIARDKDRTDIAKDVYLFLLANRPDMEDRARAKLAANLTELLMKEIMVS
jgi:hypothetical protein